MENISVYVNSIFSSICYKFEDIIIDPGDLWDGFKGINHILLTHAHFDHIYGLNALLELNPQAFIYTNSVGREMLLNSKRNLSFFHGLPFELSSPSKIHTIQDREIIKTTNGTEITAFFTSGHSDSCVTWLTNDVVFTGDSYIPGTKTITNLPGGNKELSEKSISLIESISHNRIICPGHRLKD